MQDLLDKESVKRVAHIINQKTGIRLGDEKLVDLERIIYGILEKKKIQLPLYMMTLEQERDEVVRLASEFTIQETSFYRNRDHYHCLLEYTLPQIIQRKRLSGDLSITLVSAGCATGEEPYTLAMLMLELLPDIEAWKIQIIGADIYDKAIEIAKKGLYNQYKMRNIGDYYIQKYFQIIQHKNYSDYEIKEQVKKLVTFQRVNLLSEPFELGYLQNVDLLLCENVIIYFDHESTERLIKNFYHILSPDGYLYLGYSETLNMIPNDFLVSWYENTYFYVKKQEMIYMAENNNDRTAGEYQQFRHLNDLFEKGYHAYCSSENNELERMASQILEATSFLHSDKENEQLFLLLAEFFLDSRKYLNAIKYAQMAVSNKPISPASHQLSALLYLEMDMPDKADLELSMACYIDPENPLTYYIYHLYYHKMGDAVRSGENFRMAQEKMKIKPLFFEKCFPYNLARRKTIESELSGRL